MRLISSRGDVVKGRCRATNQCAYCAKLAAVETSEMLALDALNGEAPAIWAVLTTSSTSTDPADFYEHRRKVQKAVKRRWPAAEFAWVLEFTTGYGPRAGGRRRPHWNLMLKGVPADDVEPVGALMRRVWCERTGGKTAAQYVGLIEHHGGLMRYLALHFLKESQAPPAGWRGHRFTATRGYLWVPAPEARAAAQESLRGKRRLHRALVLGLAGEEAELAAELERATQADTTWRLVITRNPTQLDQTGQEVAAGAASLCPPPPAEVLASAGLVAAANAGHQGDEDDAECQQRRRIQSHGQPPFCSSSSTVSAAVTDGRTLPATTAQSGS